MPPLPSESFFWGRKFHQKSHNGCKKCKARRVKCDESRPKCGACTRRKEDCIWGESSLRSSTASNSSDGVTSSVRAVGGPLASILNASPSSTSLGTLFPSEFDMKSLEMLHNYTTHTLATFVPAEANTRYGFQVLAPQLAFQNPCIMHAIFAISSLHLHATRPSGDYLDISRSHFQRAILDMNQFSLTPSPPSRGGVASVEVTSDVSYVANAILSMYCLASPPWKSSAKDGYSDIFDWFPPARALMLQLGKFWVSVRTGHVQQSAFLPQHLTVLATEPLNLDILPPLLIDILDPVLCPMQKEELLDEAIVRIYMFMILKVQHACTLLSSPETENFAPYVFLSSIRDLFFHLFMNRQPRALIIVAHFLALLGQFDRTWWYGADRAKHDIQRIVSLLPRDEWLPFMEYPLSTIRRRQEEVIDSVFGSGFLDETSAALPSSVDNDLSLSSMYIGTQPIHWTPHSY